MTISIKITPYNSSLTTILATDLIEVEYYSTKQCIPFIELSTLLVKQFSSSDSPKVVNIEVSEFTSSATGAILSEINDFIVASNTPTSTVKEYDSLHPSISKLIKLKANDLINVLVDVSVLGTRGLTFIINHQTNKVGWTYTSPIETISGTTPIPTTGNLSVIGRLIPSIIAPFRQSESDVLGNPFIMDPLVHTWLCSTDKDSPEYELTLE